MIDIGQADSSLRRNPATYTIRPCWTVCLKRAAKEMGFNHYMNVPMDRDKELRNKAYEIAGIVIC